MSLCRLPYELVWYVVQHLDLADTRNLSASCKEMQFLLREDRICKAILETKAAGAPETRRAHINKRYAAELRRLLKRREAIAAVSPYLVSVVAVAETWLFADGALLYISERQLRILDLHNSASAELVVDIRVLLDDTIVESRDSTKYSFKLLHYAGGFASCLYTHAMPDQASWLIVFNAKQRTVLPARRLDSAHKIFVRNTSEYLYYGTYSLCSPDGDRRWYLRGCDIPKRRWHDKAICLEDIIGSDIGSTVCFEIFDNFLYVVSSNTTFERDAYDWTSYYGCVRIPFDDEPLCLHKDPKWNKKLWRRQHKDGPIDDRWMLLCVVRDEASGRLQVLESRKEWLHGRSTARRNYYVRDLDFDRSEDDENKAITVHRGDDDSTTGTFPLTKTFIRSYHLACHTYVDLVDDSPSPTQQLLRLRGGSSYLEAPRNEKDKVADGCSVGTPGLESNAMPPKAETREEDIKFWPSKRDVTKPDRALDKLNAILTPQGYAGNVHGRWDDRSMVYATGGGRKGLKALVFVSFDPAIFLAGAKPYPGVSAIEAPVGKDSEILRQPGTLGDVTPSVAQTRAADDAGRWARCEPAMYRHIGVGYHFAR